MLSAVIIFDDVILRSVLNVMSNNVDVGKLLSAFKTILFSLDKSNFSTPFIEEGIEIDFKDSHSLKANSPIFLTLEEPICQF